MLRVEPKKVTLKLTSYHFSMIGYYLQSDLRL